jgi:hypothetical protein
LSASPTGTGGQGEEAFVEAVAGGTRSSRLGRVQAFDAERGRGLVVAVGGAVFGFHGTAITDGTRQIDVGALSPSWPPPRRAGVTRLLRSHPPGPLADDQAVPGQSPFK